MRKELVLPVLAVAGGAAGFCLRRWELATAFEADTGLHIPFAPATIALIALSVGMAVVFLLLSLGEHSAFPGGYGQAFGAAGNMPYAAAVVLSAFLLLASAALNFLGLPAAYAAGAATAQTTPANPLLSVLARVVVGILSALSFFAVLSIARSGLRDGGERKYSLPLLVPAFTCGIWLIESYQLRAGDPVVLDYLYELFAIMAALLALYFIAGFSFERPKVLSSSLFSALGVYFSLTTLADGHSLYVTLLYLFAAVYLTANLALLHYNDRIYRDAQPPADEAAPETGDAKLEERPHEP